ncbi:AP180 protein [Hibiscus syriacus]|uniref:AP180 protein n=1 Tax=Hibiscus syriacus TaxID=106335 RepID=A0A6A2YII3_HIBSY|nr:AP180 protein [Hibiscus syriacus]
MPCKLNKAIGAVKDHTSISLAKVVNTNSASLEVAVLKATTHDQSTIHDRYVQEILKTVSSNQLFARIAARSIAKRLGKTKSWVVALKCLMLVLRIVQDGDPFFPKEVLHAMNQKAKTLNLPTFRDDTNSSPCDYTVFVESFESYLEERLDCFLTGKLQRRVTSKEKQVMNPRSRGVSQQIQSVQHMKPPMLLDRISSWQRLLDNVIATKPTGAAKRNQLVLVALYAVVEESFDLYRDISNGLGFVLDGFFHMQHQSCVSTIEYCVKASIQFEDLSIFYESCKGMAVGKTSDYPNVHGISEELLQTLKEFVKHQASFPLKSPSLKSPQLLRIVSTAAKDLSIPEEPDSSARVSRASSMTLEDLIKQHQEEDESVAAMRASFSIGNFSELSRKQFDEQEIDFISFDEWPNVENNNNNNIALAQKCTETYSYSANALKGALPPSQNLSNDQSFFDDWTKQGSKTGVTGVSFSNSLFQEDHRNDQLASQNGAHSGLFSNGWFQEDQLASQNGATDVSFPSNWLQGDHANDQQASANGVSFPNSWLQDDNRINRQASENGPNGVSFPNSWLQEDNRIDQQASQNGAMGNSYINDWLQQQLQHDQASNNEADGHSCFDDWLKEDKNLDHNSHQQLVTFDYNVCFDDWLQGNQITKPAQQTQNSAPNWSNNNGANENWEIVLVETTVRTSQPSQRLVNGIEPNHLFDQKHIVPQRQYNPFLEDETDMSVSIAATTGDNVADFSDGFSMVPVFQATPTFFAQSFNEITAAPTFQAVPRSGPQNLNGTTTAAFGDSEADNPFSPWPSVKSSNNLSVDQQNILLQQQFWLQ